MRRLRAYLPRNPEHSRPNVPTYTNLRAASRLTSLSLFRIHLQNCETGRKCLNEPVELKRLNEQAPVYATSSKPGPRHSLVDGCKMHRPEDEDCAHELEGAPETAWIGRPGEGKTP
jgi:hypothetical protein